MAHPLRPDDSESFRAPSIRHHANPAPPCPERSCRRSEERLPRGEVEIRGYVRVEWCTMTRPESSNVKPKLRKLADMASDVWRGRSFNITRLTTHDGRRFVFNIVRCSTAAKDRVEHGSARIDASLLPSCHFIDDAKLL